VRPFGVAPGGRRQHVDFSACLGCGRRALNSVALERLKESDRRASVGKHTYINIYISMPRSPSRTEHDNYSKNTRRTHTHAYTHTRTHARTQQLERSTHNTHNNTRMPRFPIAARRDHVSFQCSRCCPKWTRAIHPFPSHALPECGYKTRWSPNYWRIRGISSTRPLCFKVDILCPAPLNQFP
jgi:hypothetical protein